MKKSLFKKTRGLFNSNREIKGTALLINERAYCLAFLHVKNLSGETHVMQPGSHTPEQQQHAVGGGDTSFNALTKIRESDSSTNSWMSISFAN